MFNFGYVQFNSQTGYVGRINEPLEVKIHFNSIFEKGLVLGIGARKTEKWPLPSRNVQSSWRNRLPAYTKVT